MKDMSRSLVQSVQGLFSDPRPGAARFRPAEAYLAAKIWRADFKRIAFLILVVIPTVCAIIFFGLLAAPRYVSEATFVVRSVSSQKIGGLDMLFRTFGIARAADDGYIVQRYLDSRDVVADLERNGVDVAAIFSRPEGDVFSKYPRFWRSRSQESLYDFFRSRVTVREDTVKGVIDLRVETFRPEDSRLVAEKLLELAEGMVNRMNQRAREDATVVGEREVERAKKAVIAAQSALTDFRNRELILDPSSTTMTMVETLGDLSTTLSRTQAELALLRSTSPTSPSIPALRARASSLEERIRAERAKMVGGDDALANKVMAYEQLAVQRDIASSMLASGLTALESARQEAQRQHIYLEGVSRPNLPDDSTSPRRVRGIITVLVFGFAIFAVVWILVVGSGEHAQ